MTFEEQFAQALNVGAGSYAAAEAAKVWPPLDPLTFNDQYAVPMNDFWKP